MDGIASPRDCCCHSFVFVFVFVFAFVFVFVFVFVFAFVFAFVFFYPISKIKGLFVIRLFFRCLCLCLPITKIKGGTFVHEVQIIILCETKGAQV
jgi:hypothetical protein